MNNSVKTLLREGNNFVEKNKLYGVTATVGGWTWGFLRAVLECPDCPGFFRIPINDEGNIIQCPNCKGIWKQKD